MHWILKRILLLRNFVSFSKYGTICIIIMPKYEDHRKSYKTPTEKPDKIVNTVKNTSHFAKNHPRFVKNRG